MTTDPAVGHGASHGHGSEGAATRLRLATEDRDVAVRRWQQAAHFTLALIETQSIEDLVRVVADDGLSGLGCNGGAVGVLDPTDPGTLLSYLAVTYGEGVQRDYGRLPLSAQLPATVAARTGDVVVVADLAQCCGRPYVRPSLTCRAATGVSSSGP